MWIDDFYLSVSISHNMLLELYYISCIDWYGTICNILEVKYCTMSIILYSSIL